MIAEIALTCRPAVVVDASILARFPAQEIADRLRGSGAHLLSEDGSHLGEGAEDVPAIAANDNIIIAGRLVWDDHIGGPALRACDFLCDRLQHSFPLRLTVEEKHRPVTESSATP